MVWDASIYNLLHVIYSFSFKALIGIGKKPVYNNNIQIVQNIATVDVDQIIHSMHYRDNGGTAKQQGIIHTMNDQDN